MRQLTVLRASDPPEAFPSPADALTSPDGLLCVGGDLSPARLIAAYRRGIFPWYSDGQPILWWSPDPRCYLDLTELRVPRSVRRGLRDAQGYALTLDTDFDAVVAGCARPRYPGDGTWITADMHSAYAALHAEGHAHSIEVRDSDGLIGGIYGVAVGGMFCAESMFGTQSGGSRLALLALITHLREQGFAYMDCQLPSAHLLALGTRLRPRRAYLDDLRAVVDRTLPAAIWASGPLSLAQDPRV